METASGDSCSRLAAAGGKKKDPPPSASPTRTTPRRSERKRKMKRGKFVKMQLMCRQSCVTFESHRSAAAQGSPSLMQHSLFAVPRSPVSPFALVVTLIQSTSSNNSLHIGTKMRILFTQSHFCSSGGIALIIHLDPRDPRHPHLAAHPLPSSQK